MKKGSKSKTHKGDLDFTTKRGDKDFHRGGHDVKTTRKPYDAHKVGKPHVRHHSHPKKGQASRTHKGELDFTTKRGDKDFHEGGHDQRKSRRPYTEHGDVHRGKGKGDEGEQRKPRRRPHPSAHEVRKHNMGLRGFRISRGVVPRTFSGEEGAGI